MTILAKANGSNSADIYIYESIGEGFFGGGITAKAVADALKEIGSVPTLNVYLNSDGGSVFDGIAIYNQFARYQARKVVHIDGIAASIASVIAMAGDEIRIADNGMIMIHDPWGLSMGTSEDMRKYADSLDKVRDTILGTYVSRTGGKAAQIGDWMAAETWMSADEAIKNGFATKKTETKTVKAQYSMLAKFKHPPPRLMTQAKAPNSLLARMNKRVQQRNLGSSRTTA